MQTNNKLSNVKFLAFINGYTELCEFLQDATVSDYEFINSKWNGKIWYWVEEDYENLDDTLLSFKESQRREKIALKLEKTIIKQGRMCGLKFPNGDILLAQFK